MRIMKIDFNESGMTINFDKVPKFLYFNENNEGCGQVFLDGVRRKGLQDIKVQAHTFDEKSRYPLKYRIQYFENHVSQVIGNIRDELSVNIKILDLEKFQGFMDCVKKYLNDERIPEIIRNEHFNSLKEFTNRFEKGE
jgi:hypothetical protein